MRSGADGVASWISLSSSSPSASSSRISDSIELVRVGCVVVAMLVEREYGSGGSPLGLCGLAGLPVTRGREASGSDLCASRPVATFLSSRATGFHLSVSRS